MVPRHAFHSSTVGDHHSWKGPLLPQVLLQQFRAGACWDAIHSVVGAHHALCVALLDAGLKGWQVCVCSIPGKAGQLVLNIETIDGLGDSCIDIEVAVTAPKPL